MFTYGYPDKKKTKGLKAMRRMRMISFTLGLIGSILLMLWVISPSNLLMFCDLPATLPVLVGILFVFVNFLPFDIIMAIKDVFVDIRDERFSEEALKSRYEKAESVFLTMRRYVIAFSLLGSIILFIKKVFLSEDPVVLLLEFSLIPLLLFYGIIASELVCLPMAIQLRKKASYIAGLEKTL
jgi:flagellar motor component MotA